MAAASHIRCRCLLPYTRHPQFSPHRPHLLRRPSHTAHAQPRSPGGTTSAHYISTTCRTRDIVCQCCASTCSPRYRSWHMGRRTRKRTRMVPFDVSYRFCQVYCQSGSDPTVTHAGGTSIVRRTSLDHSRVPHGIASLDSPENAERNCSAAQVQEVPGKCQSRPRGKRQSTYRRRTVPGFSVP
jgi:hypothetical protein